jgi:hypothetical protein
MYPTRIWGTEMKPHRSKHRRRLDIWGKAERFSICMLAKLLVRINAALTSVWPSILWVKEQNDIEGVGVVNGIWDKRKSPLLWASSIQVEREIRSSWEKFIDVEPKQMLFTAVSASGTSDHGMRDWSVLLGRWLFGGIPTDDKGPAMHDPFALGIVQYRAGRCSREEARPLMFGVNV